MLASGVYCNLSFGGAHLARLMASGAQSLKLKHVPPFKVASPGAAAAFTKGQLVKHVVAACSVVAAMPPEFVCGDGQARE